VIGSAGNRSKAKEGRNQKLKVTRPEATVSMPVTWTEVARHLPDVLTVRAAVLD